MASGLYLLTWIDILDTSQLAVNLSSTANKVAMFTSSLATPNFSSDTAYAVAPYNSNEVSSAGYSAGGLAVASPTVTESPAGSLMFDLADSEWTGTTINLARYALLHADGLSPKAAICLVDFGSNYSTVAGTFKIQWATTGMFALDMTP